MKNKTIAKIIVPAATAILLYSCGTPSKAVRKDDSGFPESGDALVLLGMKSANIFNRSEAGRPVVYGIEPHGDSLGFRVASLTKVKRTWTKISDVRYPSDEIAAKLTRSYGAEEKTLPDGRNYLILRTERENPEKIIYEISAYSPEDYALYTLIFSGRRKKDGLIYGYDGIEDRLDNKQPSLIWAHSEFRKDKNLVFMSKAERLSEEYTRMWMEKNASGNTGKIQFALLPRECSLVEAFNAAKKKSSKSMSAAIVDTDEYTYIIAANRKNGTYLLAWAEPLCKNSKTDQLLNAIEFSSQTELILYYYKGNKAYKRRLSLSSGSLR